MSDVQMHEHSLLAVIRDPKVYGCVTHFLILRSNSERFPVGFPVNPVIHKVCHPVKISSGPKSADCSKEPHDGVISQFRRTCMCASSFRFDNGISVFIGNAHPLRNGPFLCIPSRHGLYSFQHQPAFPGDNVGNRSAMERKNPDVSLLRMVHSSNDIGDVFLRVNERILRIGSKACHGQLLPGMDIMKNTLAAALLVCSEDDPDPSCERKVKILNCFQCIEGRNRRSFIILCAAAVKLSSPHFRKKGIALPQLSVSCRNDIEMAKNCHHLPAFPDLDISCPVIDIYGAEAKCSSEIKSKRKGSSRFPSIRRPFFRISADAWNPDGSADRIEDLFLQGIHF